MTHYLIYFMLMYLLAGYVILQHVILPRRLAKGTEEHHVASLIGFVVIVALIFLTDLVLSSFGDGMSRDRYEYYAIWMFAGVVILPYIYFIPPRLGVQVAKLPERKKEITWAEFFRGIPAAMIGGVLFGSCVVFIEYLFELFYS